MKTQKSGGGKGATGVKGKDMWNRKERGKDRKVELVTAGGEREKTEKLSGK